MDALSFIGACIGADAPTCQKIDDIEDKFRVYEFYDLPETDVREFVLADQKHVGSMIIAEYYRRIIESYVDAYSDYPLTEDLFAYYAQGVDSVLIFNGEQVDSKEELDQAVKEWILNLQKR